MEQFWDINIIHLLNLTSYSYLHFREMLAVLVFHRSHKLQCSRRILKHDLSRCGHISVQVPQLSISDLELTPRPPLYPGK